MAICGSCGEKAPAGTSVCDRCYQVRAQRREIARVQQTAEAATELAARLARLETMLVSNTHTLPGHRILGLSGVVSAESVFGMNLIKDMASSLTDTFGGRSGTLERGLSQARAACLEDLKVAADEIGANAVIGVQLNGDIITPGATASKMIMVTGLGTAVVAVPE